MLDRLELMEKRYNEITNLLSQPDITNNIKEMTSLLKEQKGLEEPVFLYQKYIRTNKTLKELKVLMDDEDEEISMMAKMEYEEIKETVEPMLEKMKVLLLPKDPDDDKNVIVEIKGATGGDRRASCRERV